MNFFWNTVMTFVFPVEIEYMGTSATFFLYAVVLMAALWFIYHRVPETKGLTLEEIEARFLLLAQSQSPAAVLESATKTRYVCCMFFYMHFVIYVCMCSCTYIIRVPY